MKKFLITILSIFCCLFFSLGLVACNNENPNDNSGGQNPPEVQGFSLTTNIPNCTIDGTKIQFVVSNETDSYSFINAFNFPEEYKWELHWDKACLPSLNVVSKSVDLEQGNNILYALFINKNNVDDVYLYEILAHRSHTVTISYYDDDSLLYTEQVMSGQIFTPTYIPEFVGYDFCSWQLENKENAQSILLLTATNFYVLKTPIQYTITYDVNGGNPLTNIYQTVEYGEDYSLVVPAKEDYSFSGWCTEDNILISNTGKWEIASNITLTASWLYEYIVYTGNMGDSFLKSLIKVTPSTKNEEINGETKTTYNVLFELDASQNSNINTLKSWSLSFELVINVFVKYYDIRGNYQTCNLDFYTLRGSIGSEEYYKNYYNLGYYVTPSSMRVLLEQEKGLGCTLIEYETSMFSFTYNVAGTIIYK